MRTTVDLPDALYRKTKAVAALRGLKMKDIIIKAVEHEVNQVPPKAPQKRVKLPLIPWKGDKKLDLTGFDFDELLG
jgi:hypothetical protein